MPRYTDRDRQKSIETRRRNAKIRRDEIAKLGYNPYNPTVKLTDNVIVTKKVENRLSKKAEESTSLSLLEIILALISVGSFIIFISARPFSLWNFIFLIPVVIVGILLMHTRQNRVKSRTNQLALERKAIIEERKQFYSSPEWRQVRTQVIKAKGRVCSECGNIIENSYDVTVDHIRPRSKYPELALDKENLCVLCRSCNSSKGDRDSEISVFE